jgi:hypothetical protein
MPLDGSTYLTDWHLKQLADLDRLDEWFCDESRWCKGTTYRDSSGYSIGRADRAASSCLLGAISFHCSVVIQVRNLLTHAALNSGRATQSGFVLPSFNDAPSTTFADIKSVIQRAREAVLAECR